MTKLQVLVAYRIHKQVLAIFLAGARSLPEFKTNSTSIVKKFLNKLIYLEPNKYH